jgi:hypothetical protein
LIRSFGGIANGVLELWFGGYWIRDMDGRMDLGLEIGISRGERIRHCLRLCTVSLVLLPDDEISQDMAPDSSLRVWILVVLLWPLFRQITF